jgi:hypothetical protein
MESFDRTTRPAEHRDRAAAEADGEYLRSVALGYRLSQALYVFAELRIADVLASGPATPDAIAAQTGADPDALRRLLRVSRAMGLVEETAEGRLALTPRGGLLCSAAPGSLWPRVRAVGESWHWGPWGRLLDTVTSGKSAFEVEYGVTSFDYFDRHPGTGEPMMNRVTDEARLRGAAIADAFDFASANTVVDVGGGRGAILGMLLRRHPHLRGVLYDLPYAVDGSTEVLAGLGVADRCEVVAGDFRVDLPAGGDVYLLSAVVHSWSDDDSVRLLERCLAHGRRVLVADEVVPPADSSVNGLLKDLQLMVFCGGRLRSLEEYRLLFSRAGAELIRHTAIRRDELVMEGALMM